MSALEGARVRAKVLVETEFVDAEGVVVAVAASPAGQYPLPASWQCLVLFDAPAPGEALLRVVDSTALAILSAPALTPNITTGDAAEALAQAGATIKRQSLQLVALENESATLAAEVASLKKKASKKPAPPVAVVALCHGCSRPPSEHPNDTGCTAWHSSP